MIPYIILYVVAMFSQKNFWKFWLICSPIVAVYSIVAGVYLLCSQNNLPFSLEYLTGLNWPETPVVLIWAAGQTFAVFFGARFFLWMTGRAYWKRDYFAS
jgi:hypothetical protein